MSFTEILKMDIEDINLAVKQRSEWIELALKEKSSVDVEMLRQWSNELYALNSARLQRVLSEQKENKETH